MRSKWFGVVSLKRVALAAMVVSLILIYAVLWLRMVNDQELYTGTDYIAFYAGARIAREQSPAMAYNLEQQRRYESQVVGFEIKIGDVNLFVHPPFIIPLVLLSIQRTFIASLITWQWFMLIFLLGGVAALFFYLKDQISRPALFIFLAGLVLFLPAYEGLLIGQNSAILFLGACLWLVGFMTNRDWLAGMGLALMTIRPHLALPLALPFLFKRRKIFGWFLVGAGVLGLFSLANSGMEGIQAFLRMVSVSAEGVNTTIKEKSMVNLLGLLANLFPTVRAESLRLAAWIAYLLNMAGLCLLWWRTPKLEGKHLGLALLLATFTSPHLHFHDLVLWSLPLVVVLAAIKSQPVLVERTYFFPWLISMVFLFWFMPGLVHFWIPLFILVFLAVLLFNPEKVLSWSLRRAEGEG